MNRMYLRQVLNTEANSILERLTNAQHLSPHRPLREALTQTIDELGCCPAAIERGLAWLQVDANQPIGRLRRTELMQLARAIGRFWRQAERKPESAEIERA